MLCQGVLLPLATTRRSYLGPNCKRGIVMSSWEAEQDAIIAMCFGAASTWEAEQDVLIKQRFGIASSWEEEQEACINS